MTRTEKYQRHLMYKANLIDSPAIRSTNKALAQIYAPKRTAARTKKP